MQDMADVLGGAEVLDHIVLVAMIAIRGVVAFGAGDADDS